MVKRGKKVAETKAAKVMVVDDEPTMTKLIGLLLEDETSCVVAQYNDPIEAYKDLLSQPFDVISLDHRMPQMTGMAILQLLRNGDGPNRRTPVLIFTGYRDEVEALGAQILENVLMLDKPISDEQYLRNVRLALHMKKIQEQKAA